MSVALALLPVVAVIVALVCRQSSLRAGVLGAGVAIVVAATWFSLDLETAARAAAEWWPLLLEVPLIMAGGIVFAEVGRETGAQARLSDWLRASLGGGVAPVLAIVHGVTPFAESVTGFGIGAVLAVPLLSALGLDGRRAAIVGLLGLCTVPWGSMAPGSLIAAELGGVGFDAIGIASAIGSLPIFIVVGVAAVLVSGRSAGRSPGRGGRWIACLAAIGSALVLWVGVLGANLLAGTAPAGVLGGLFALAVHLLLSRLRGVRIEWSYELRRVLIPYAVLIGGVLVAGAIVRICGATGTPWRFTASPAVWLFVAALVVARARPGSLAAVRARSTATWARVGPATGLFVLLGVVMSVSGMSEEIASWMADLGRGYLFMIPFIGALGGFTTGSNSGSNAMFAAAHAHTVASIGAAPLPALAAQNVSAALLTMAAPARIELAVRLCPDPPPRNAVQLPLLAIDLALVALLGVVLLLAA